ncbi:MAG: right-handed parallel beta-helix repeat-containing protein [Armatimonadetes bacterium]|nr:right-handed parallel beta-helix repeat-containing protein [Armatimonadota bacterium]
MILWLAGFAVFGVAATVAQGDFYVAPKGNDAWSGRLAAPNRSGTDGPFRTLQRARDAVRAEKGRPGKGPLRVLVRGGTYYLDEPLVLTPADSGTAQRPVIYAAHPGEKPVISGGRPVTGWRKVPGRLYAARLGWVPKTNGRYCLLLVGDELQIRARHPNYDPANPHTGGYLFVRQPAHWAGDFGARVGSIHNPGDFLEWEVDVPADGEYVFWLYYGAYNGPFGRETMDDRTQLTVDGGPPIPLRDLADTGDWGAFRWGRCAVSSLGAGRHTIRWTNVKGGGLNLDAFALCDDQDWQPAGSDNLAAPPGKHLVIVQCEAFSKAQGSQMTVDGYVDRTGTHIYFDRGALKAWPLSPDKELHIFVYEGGICSNSVVPVASIDEEQSLMVTARRPGGYRPEVGARFFVEDVREALDSPGEWYLDKATGELTYWPRRADFTKQPAVISVLDRLIELRSKPGEQPVEYISFEGFTFTCTDYTDEQDDWYHSASAAIWLRAASHCKFVRNRFVNLGGTGIVMVGNCCHNEVTDNEFCYLGAGGVTINGNPENKHLGLAEPGKPAEHNVVARNHIHHTGITFKHGNPVCLNSAENCLIANNYIHDHPRQGIVLTKACGGNRIEYNELRNNSLETADTGAIYTYETLHLPTPNIIRGNLVVNTVGLATRQDGSFVSRDFSWGIYIDGESSNWVVRDNVVVGASWGLVFINGGRNNVVENNIFVDGWKGQIMYSNYSTRGTGNIFRRNIVAWSDPEVPLFRPGGWAKDKNLVDADYNLYWHGGHPIPELDELRQAGLDTHSIVADPLFVSPAQGDYRVRGESPAKALGFEPIDTSLIGLRRCRVK